MALQNNYGGTGQLTIDGAAQVVATLTEELGGKVRTAKVAAITGQVGATSKFDAGMLDIEFLDDGSIDEATLQGINNSTFLWANDNGKTCTFSGVFQTDKISTNPAEGTIKAKFSYQSRTVITA